MHISLSLSLCVNFRLPEQIILLSNYFRSKNLPFRGTNIFSIWNKTIQSEARRSYLPPHPLPTNNIFVARLVHSWQVERYLQKRSMFWDWLVKSFPQGIQVGFHSRPYVGKNKQQYGMWRGDTRMEGGAQSRLHVFQEFSWTLGLGIISKGHINTAPNAANRKMLPHLPRTGPKREKIRLKYSSSNTTKNFKHVCK